MYDIRVIEYGSPEYQDMLLLREALLRTPLGLTFSQQELQREISDRLIGCFHPKQSVLLGCCMLTPIDENIVQLRQMAVVEKYQHRGIGKKLVRFAEGEARQSGFATIIAHARKPAVPFYERSGFIKEGEEFTEVTLPHFLVKKTLGPQTNDV